MRLSFSRALFSALVAFVVCAPSAHADDGTLVACRAPGVHIPPPTSALAIAVRYQTDTIRNSTRSPSICSKATEIDSLVGMLVPDTALQRKVAERVTFIVGRSTSPTVTRTALRINTLVASAVTSPPPTVAAVQLSSARDTITVGDTLRFSAIAQDAQGNTIPGQTFTWASSAPLVATIASDGLATAVAEGTATITGTTSSINGTATLVVIAAPPVVATVEVTPSTVSTTVGATGTQLTATAKDAGNNVIPGRPVAWSTNDASIATVTAGGVVVGVGVGSATITATIDGVSGTSAITVGPSPVVVASVTVTPSPWSVVAGSTVQLTATPKDAGGATITGKAVTWASTATSVATVSASGLVTGVAVGSATITATVDAIVGSSAGTVTSPPVVNPTVELPNDSVAAYPLPATPGTVRLVHTGGNLQTALTSAVRGDKIVLDAGATFTGSFTLPAKTGTAADGSITVTSSGSCPTEGTRVDSTHLAQMATLQGVGYAATLQTALSAKGWVVRCLHITDDPAYTTYENPGIVKLGDGSSAQNSLGVIAEDLIFAQNFVESKGVKGTKRCVALNSYRTAIVDNWLQRCGAKGLDSQCIGGWNARGTFLIENNTMICSGENFFFGGSDPAVHNLVVSNIIFRRNWVYSPASYKPLFTKKVLLEMKSVWLMLIEANIFDGSWVDGQTGFAINFKSVNQGGNCPGCFARDITVRWNVFRNASAGISLAGHPETYAIAQPLNHVQIEQNLFYNIGNYLSTCNGRMIAHLNEADYITFKNNTMIHEPQPLPCSGQWMIGDTASKGAGVASHNTFSDNIGTWGGPYFAIIASSAGATQGTQSFTKLGFTTVSGNRLLEMPTSMQGYYPSSQGWLFGNRSNCLQNYPLRDSTLDAFIPIGNCVGKGVDINTLKDKLQGVAR
jgi:uncharacterized protein YjdB